MNTLSVLRKKASLITIISFCILFSTDALSSDGMVTVIRERTFWNIIKDLFSSETKISSRLYYSGSPNASVIVEEKDNGNASSFFFASGKAAENLTNTKKTSSSHDPLPPPPPKPQQIKIFSQETFIGGLTEIIPQSEAYITARHILQDHDPEALKQWLTETGLSEDKYYFYEFTLPSSKDGKDKSQEPLDVIVAVPIQNDGNFFEDVNPDNCHCALPGTLKKLKFRTEYRASVSPHDDYFSWQYGINGKTPVTQHSQGQISPQIGFDGKLFAPIKPENFTTLGSSGSTVMTAKPLSGNWKFSGIFECFSPPLEIKGVSIPGGNRIIPVTLLLDAQAKRIKLSDLAKEKKIQDKKCIHTGGGDGGN